MKYSGRRSIFTAAFIVFYPPFLETIQT